MTLADVLRNRAHLSPDRIAYRFLADDECEVGTLTYGELDKRARATAANLWSLGAFQQTVLLLYPPCIEYIVGFMGCMYAGAIAVPAYPPKINRPDVRFRHVAGECKADVVLTTSSLAPSVKQYLSQTTPNVKIIATELVEENTLIDRSPATGDSIALLQYTSGSTTSPRGVMVSHDNIMYNSTFLREAFEYDSDSVCVSWLPMYHDMGLIGAVIQPLIGGFTCVLTSPASFLQRPIRWLRTISKYRATISGGPNFAFDLCVRRVSETDKTDLNLGSWSVAFNGSEQVRVETLDRFANAFAPCGFRKKAFRPCYGLAEGTLIVSGGGNAHGASVMSVDRTSLASGKMSPAAPGMAERVLAGCGQIFKGEELAIVDAQTGEPCSPGVVGEVWVSSPSVARGYWSRCNETSEVFRAYLKSGRGPYLRTGDLGVLQGNELFIVGRLKDLIIIRGRNHYPHDIESSVESCHPRLRGHSSAAFSIEVNGKSGEQLVIVSEVNRHTRRNKTEEIISAIRRAVAREHDIPTYAVVLVRAGSMPKTSSGKIQHSVCREQFVAHTLQEITGEDIDHTTAIDNVPTSVDSVKGFLVAKIAEYTGIPRMTIQLEDSLLDLGLDSLSATELTISLEKEFGIEMPPGTILREGTLQQLVAQVSEARAISSSTNFITCCSAALGNKRVPLSYEQERLWSLTQLAPGSGAHNIPVALGIHGGLDVTVLKRALQEIVNRHEILRARFPVVNGDVVQEIAAGMEIELTPKDLRDNKIDPQEKALSLMELEAHKAFNVQRGPLVRAQILRVGDEDHVLLWTMHHIISDGASLNVLIQEVVSLYEALVVGRELPGPKLEVQYADFAAWQRGSIQRGVLAGQLQFWREQLREMRPLRLLANRSESDVRKPRARAESISLSPILTDNLRKVARQEGATLFMTLLSAFQILLSRYLNQEDIVVGVPVASRNHAGTDRLIGPFAHPVLIRNTVQAADLFDAVLRRTRESLLAAYDNQDVPLPTVLRKCSAEGGSTYNPLLSVMCSLLTKPRPILTSRGLKFEVLDTAPVGAPTDLYLFLTDEAEVISGWLLYDEQMVNSQTAVAIVRSYVDVLEKITYTSQVRVEALLPLRGDACPEKDVQKTMLEIRILPTFLVPQLPEILQWWMQQLGASASIEVADPAQTRYGLLYHSGFLLAPRSGTNVILIRAEDLLVNEAAQLGQHESLGRSRDTISAVVEGIRETVQAIAMPHVICMCPRSPIADDVSENVLRCEQALLSGLSAIAGVTLVNAEELLRTFVGDTYYDGISAEVAHAPYSERFVARLATIIARKIVQATAVKKKAVVLDCDGTLWGGNCAEDGPHGIQLTDGHRHLHQFMLRLRSAGMLLCLCSKNDAGDVRKVFAERPDLPLKLDDFAVMMINWREKTENLLRIANELGISLSSIVFVDDDPIEVREIRGRCPEVLVVRCPRQEEDIRGVLDNVWAFDVEPTTGEDLVRNDFYQDRQQREDARAKSFSVRQFIEDIEVVCETTPMVPDDEPRVWQLVERVNRFNLNGNRWQRSELHRLWGNPGISCLVTRVRDRFGDYGLVGVTVVESVAAACEIRIWNLSCRALGRGVEVEMLRNVGRVALKAKLEFVDVEYRASAKNYLVREFLSTLNASSTEVNGTAMKYRFAAEFLAGLTVQLEQRWCETALSANTGRMIKTTAQNDDRAHLVIDSALMERISGDLRMPENVLLLAGYSRNAVVQEHGRKAESSRTENLVRNLWGQVLQRGDVKRDDNFFELGGDSLLASRFIGRMQQELNMDLPLTLFFSSDFTVREVAKAVDGYISASCATVARTATVGNMSNVSDTTVATKN